MLLSFENTRSTQLALPTCNTAFDIWSYSHKTRNRPAKINLDGLSAKFVCKSDYLPQPEFVLFFAHTAAARHAPRAGDLAPGTGWR